MLCITDEQIWHRNDACERSYNLVLNAKKKRIIANISYASNSRLLKSILCLLLFYANKSA